MREVGKRARTERLKVAGSLGVSDLKGGETSTCKRVLLCDTGWNKAPTVRHVAVGMQEFRKLPRRANQEHRIPGICFPDLGKLGRVSDHHG